jgi:hypothetical protein
MCPYECDFVGLKEESYHNPDCLDTLSLEYQRLGGAFPFFILLLILPFLALIIFVSISLKTQMMRMEVKFNPAAIYKIWENLDSEAADKPSEQDFSFKHIHLAAHTHRMYLAGSNSPQSPWIVPLYFPQEALDEHDAKKFEDFANDVNADLEYSTLEALLLFVVKWTLRPVYSLLFSKLQERKLTLLKTKLFRFYPPQFWRNKGSNRSMRLSTPVNDLTTAYIDFIDFSKSHKEDYMGVKLPLEVLCAGDGSYERPFYLDFVADPLLMQLVFIKFSYFKDKLPIFLENFNSQLQKLSF